MLATKMQIFNKAFSRYSTNIKYLARQASSIVNHPNNVEYKIQKLKITEEDCTKLLKILNTCNANDMSDIQLSSTRIKALEKHVSKNGPFHSLDEVLETGVLTEKILQKVFKNMNGDKKDPLPKNGLNNKRIKQLVSPPLLDGQEKNVKTIVGVHIVPTGLSWVTLKVDTKEVTNWDHSIFTSLPKKMLPSDICHTALTILSKLPKGDIYIFEGNESLSPQNQTKVASVMTYVQNLELTSMLIALLNTSHFHNADLEVDSDGKILNAVNKVFQLRGKVPARLFGTLVGGEKVAAISRVHQLVNDTSDFQLPCSRISIGEPIKNMYLSQIPPNQELLCQSLMLAVSFMDLCIYKNSVSLKALSPTR